MENVNSRYYLYKTIFNALKPFYKIIEIKTRDVIYNNNNNLKKISVYTDCILHFFFSMTLSFKHQQKKRLSYALKLS